MLVFQSFFAIWSVFSAVEMQKSKSSIVAINVESFLLHFIFVKTFSFFHVVLMDKPRGVLKLSGETALAMASAISASS